MDKEESLIMNGGSGQENEMKNFKKRTKNCFLMFCEVVLKHEGIISEPLNSSQESINDNLAPDGIKYESIENSTFNSDSDTQNGEMVANYDAGNEDGGGDSFNSVTCFCGKPFAGRPMIECSGCLTWLHMSCAKVKRKNIPEFYYCDSCKSKGKGMMSPTSMFGTSSDETSMKATTVKKENNSQQQFNDTISSNGTVDGPFSPTNNSQQQQNNSSSTKPRKPKMLKKNSSSSESDSAKILKKTNANGKLKKIRQKLSPTTKKIRQGAVNAMKSSSTKAFTTEFPLLQNNQVITTPMNGITSSPDINNSSPSSTTLLKSTLATNNNIYNSVVPDAQQQNNSPSSLTNGGSGVGGGENPEKYNVSKKLKL